MKQLFLSTTVIVGLFAAPNIDSLQKQINDLQQQIKELKAKQTEQNDRYYKKVAPIVTNNHLFWSYDLRTTYDFISQTVSEWMDSSNVLHPSKSYTNNILTNRVILTGVAKPSDNLKATVKIEANNIYGMNGENGTWQNTPWFANETPDDITLRVKEAFFNYEFGDDFMFSAGRRPATEGYPANLREGDEPASPLAHLINMEFDGFSFKIGNGEVSKLSDKFNDWGTWIKFCAGRGYSSSTGKFNDNLGRNYARTTLENMDFTGFILVPYDNGQYSVWSETVWAYNVQGYQLNMATNSKTMKNFGNYFGENIIFKADGIGDGISDFLDDTKAFVSFGYSKTHANGTYTYVNTPEGNIESQSHSGYSIWIGANMPGVNDNDRFGINFVKGSKYWRNFTYGEDTLVGSIASVRGKAIDAYYNTQIIPHLTAGIRATYLKYDHPGSDGFFGMMTDPDIYTKYKMPYVTKATDIRAFIRYQF